MSIQGEIYIERPVGVVFDFAADERNEPIFNPRMLSAEKVTDGPIGAGTRFLATIKSMGRTIDATIEFTDYQRPSLLASTSRMAAADVRGVLTFEPRGEGTQMRWLWDVEPKGMSRLLTPLINRMGKSEEADIWKGLKRYLELPGR